MKSIIDWIKGKEWNYRKNSIPFDFDFSNINGLSNVGYENSVKAELTYIKNGTNFLESFSITHMTSNLEFLRERTFGRDYLEFKFGQLTIEPFYRDNKICSFVICNIILNIIRQYPKADICFSLLNTSSILGDIGSSSNLNLYDSILTRYEPGPANGTQFEIYKSRNRNKDIENLENKIKKYREKSNIL